jgi:excisionase family DNA binding protein
MGSDSPLGEWLSETDAARMLGVTTRTIRRMARNGVLVPIRDGKKVCYRYDDLAAASSVFASGGTHDLMGVMLVASKALASARRAESALEKLSTVLGIDIPKLPTERDEVISLVERIKHALQQNLPHHATEKDVLEWARVFYGVTEEYLELVGFVTGSQEPWRYFILLAQEFAEQTPVDLRFKQDLARVYAYMEAARRHLRNAAYFHARAKGGRRFADKFFPDASIDVHERIINYLFLTPTPTK